MLDHQICDFIHQIANVLQALENATDLFQTNYHREPCYATNALINTLTHAACSAS